MRPAAPATEYTSPAIKGRVTALPAQLSSQKNRRIADVTPVSNKVDPGGQLSGEVIGHEIMEAYVSVAEGITNFSTAHKRADEYFGRVEMESLRTLPAGAATAESAAAVYSFGRLGVRLNVEKVFRTPQPAASVGDNWTKIMGNLNVSPINPAPKPVPVNPKDRKP